MELPVGIQENARLHEMVAVGLGEYDVIQSLENENREAQPQSIGLTSSEMAIFDFYYSQKKH